jgi:branched-chain amino acid transport system ATP-binding protein
VGVGVDVRGLTVRYGGVTALDRVDLHVEPGELRAVIGPNGAGKSTLFSTIAGGRRPTEGTVHLDGENVTRVAASPRTRRGVVRTFQVTRVFPALSVLQNASVAVLAASRQSHAAWRLIPRHVNTRALEVLDTVGLADRANEMAGNLAQGDRKRLELAGALALSPRLLLLDEPTAGMAPDETQGIIDLIDRLWREQRMTVILTEHDVPLVFRLAQTITVLHRGALLCTDAPDRIRAREDVRKIYLGAE